MPKLPLIRSIDAIAIPVPDLDTGLAFYAGTLGHPLRWRNDEIGQAALSMPGADAEIVLTTRQEQEYAPNWLVASADESAEAIRAAGGRLVSAPTDIPVGRVAVVADPFGNPLVLVDLTKGRYVTDDAGRVTGVADPPREGS